MVASHQGTPLLQFPRCQASAHTHDQAETLDQDLGAQNQVTAKVSQSVEFYSCSSAIEI